MKTLFTLLFTMALFGTTWAQYGQNGHRDRDRYDDVYAPHNNRGYDRHHNGGNGSYFFSPRERDMQIAQINRDYEYKIYSVKNKPYMGWYQKKRIINNLEAERDEQIFQVIRKFKNQRNQFGDHGRRERRNW